MAPQARASSTIGVKKSTVATMARLSLSRYTAASSRVAASTSTRGSRMPGTWRSTWVSSAGPSLQAHPAPCDRAVSRILGVGSVEVSVMTGSYHERSRLRCPVCPEGRSETDQRALLAGSGSEAPVRPLSGRERRQGPAHQRQRVGAPHGEEHVERGEEVRISPPAVLSLALRHDRKQPVGRVAPGRSGLGQRVHPRDDGIGRERGRPPAPLFGESGEALEVAAHRRPAPFSRAEHRPEREGTQGETRGGLRPEELAVRQRDGSQALLRRRWREEADQKVLAEATSMPLLGAALAEGAPPPLEPPQPADGGADGPAVPRLAEIEQLVHPPHG